MLNCIYVLMVQKTKEKKKNKGLHEEITIPEGINVAIDNNIIIVNKDDKKILRTLPPSIEFKIADNKIVMSSVKDRKIEKRLFGTFRAHLNNMIKGLLDGFQYTLRVSNVHFPMNVSYDKNKKQIVIKNFLGEKKDRIIDTLDGVDVKVENENVIVTSYDIEKAGQVATRIEKGSRVRNRDRRIFQDGIFIIEKPGRIYLEE